MGANPSTLDASLSSLSSDASKATSKDTGIIVKAGVCNADPVSKSGKHIQMAQMLVFPMIPMLLLVIQTSIGLSDYVNVHSTLNSLSLQIDDTQELCDVIHALQLERAESVLLFNKSGNSTADMVPRYEQTDKNLLKLSKWLSFTDSLNFAMSSKMNFKKAIREHRRLIELGKVTMHRHLEFYNNANQELIEELSQIIRGTNHRDLWRSLIALRLITRAKENFGITMVWGVVKFMKGKLTDYEFQELAQNEAMAQEHMDVAVLHSNTARKLYQDRFRIESSKIREDLKEYERMIFNRIYEQSFDISLVWLDNYTQFLHILRDIRISIKDEIDGKISREVQGAYTQVIISATILLLVVIVAPIVTLLINHVTQTIQTYAMGLSEVTKELRKEKRRADALLYRMLPKSIAIQLKLGQPVEAESFQCATILFTDIVGFTSLASQSTPMQVTEFLNKLFQFCDNILNKYDVYKVETIGDAYMVASGVPQRNGIRHVGQISSVSLELLDKITSFTIPHMPERILSLRLGIHSGPVAAGVVGLKMPRYCLFGETVTIAGKMESLGVPMKIQISSSTKGLLDDTGGFTTDRRGLIDVSGKGTMETHFLLGPSAEAIAEPSTCSMGCIKTKKSKYQKELPMLDPLLINETEM